MSDFEQSVAKIVADKLKTMILVDKIYKPSEKLPNQRDLAIFMGVSRSSIREAIGTLEAQHILIAKRGSGTYVSDNPGMGNDPLGLNEIFDQKKLILDLYEARLALEPETIRFATLRASISEIEEIEKIQQECESLLYNEKEWINNEKKFHSSIARASHNEVLERFIPSLFESIRLSIEYMLKHAPHQVEKLRNNTQHNHKLMIGLVKSGDDLGASLAMRYHIMLGIKDLESL